MFFKNLFSLIFSVILISSVFAQGYQRMEGNAKARVYGKVVDADTQQALEYTTVSILNKKDNSVVTGGLTDARGEFSIPDVPAGVYRVRISFIGYRDAVKDSLRVSPGQPEINLGAISLRTAAAALDEVVVSAEKPVFESGIDRRIFNVEKNLVSQGGSATDILESIPSIAVDQDGNISLRGSGSVMVLIDGKPSGLTGTDRNAILEQIPASSIERIEVITNPSAKYDAEGVGGIINVILKKNKLQGTTGMVSVSAGTRDKYNASASLNFKYDKWNIYSNYSYRLNNNLFNRYYDQRSQLSEDTLFNRLQDGGGNRNGTDNLFRVGADYNWTNTVTVGVSALYRDSQGLDVDDVFSEEYYNGILDSLYTNNTTETEDGYNYELNFTLRKTFEQPGRDLNFLASKSYNYELEGERYNQTALTLDTRQPFGEAFLRKNDNDRLNDLYVVQADYVHPITEDMKLETGYKSTIRTIDTDQNFEIFNAASDSYEFDPLLSNRFIYKEQVHALYGIYTSKMGNFGYQMGLRYEQTFTEGNQVTQDERFRFDYPGLFPSVYLSYKLGNENEMQLNYSRRISRPSIRTLNPFVDASNPQSIDFGNPNLLPEFTNSFELSHLKGWEKFFLTSSVFYRSTTDVIQRVTSFEDNIQVTTFANIASRTSYGLEFINRFTPHKNFNTTLTYNLFGNEVNVGEVAGLQNQSNISWSATLMSNATIPKWFDVQLMGSYRAPTVTGQGTFNGFYFVNLAFQKEVLKKNGSISLNLSDIFDIRQFSVDTEGTNFTSYRTFKRESRIATLTFSYKFGKFVEKRGKGGRGEGGPGGDEDMF